MRLRETSLQFHSVGFVSQRQICYLFHRPAIILDSHTFPLWVNIKEDTFGRCPEGAQPFRVVRPPGAPAGSQTEMINVTESR